MQQISENNAQYHIVFLDSDTFPNGIAALRPSSPHQWQSYGLTSPNDVVTRAKTADVIVTNKVVLTAEQLAQLPKLKLIAVAATGYNIIDVEYCRAHNITVCNVQGYAVHSVPEHTIALILALRRNLVAYHAAIQNKRWHQSPHFTLFDYELNDLHSTALGIVGQGTLGKSVAKIAEAIGMKVIYLARHLDNPKPHEIDIDTFLASSDVISIHAPLTKATTNLIGKAEFAKMTKKPLIINTARGGIVNENDVVNALRAGQISGIGFDVLSHEPMQDNHPFNAILDRQDVLITPHNAWASRQAMTKLWQIVIDNIDGFVAGCVQNKVV